MLIFNLSRKRIYHIYFHCKHPPPYLLHMWDLRYADDLLSKGGAAWELWEAAMQSLVCFLEITDHLPHRALNRDALGSCLSMPVFQSSAFQTSVGRNITGELEENQRAGSHLQKFRFSRSEEEPKNFHFSPALCGVQGILPWIALRVTLF